MKTEYSEEKRKRIAQLFAARKGSVTEFAKAHHVSIHSLYEWKRKYIGSEAQGVKCDRKLMRSNVRLLRLIAALQSSRFFTQATHNERLQEIERLSSDFPIRIPEVAFGIPHGTFQNRRYRGKGDNRWCDKRRRELE